jgi:hypothetical protein
VLIHSRIKAGRLVARLPFALASASYCLGIQTAGTGRIHAGQGQSKAEVFVQPFGGGGGRTGGRGMAVYRVCCFGIRVGGKEK